jgi:hypothetical protein
MLRMRRWWVCGLAFVALSLASPVALYGQSDTWIIHYNVPEQRVQIADDRGRLRVWRFQANAHIWEDGRTRGSALLERGGESYELEYQSATWVFNDDGSVASVIFVGEGVRTSGNRDQGFGFVEIVQQEEGGKSTPDVLIFLGPGVHPGDIELEEMRFEASGSIRAR